MPWIIAAVLGLFLLLGLINYLLNPFIFQKRALQGVANVLISVTSFSP